MFIDLSQTINSLEIDTIVKQKRSDSKVSKSGFAILKMAIKLIRGRAGTRTGQALLPPLLLAFHLTLVGWVILTP